MTTETSLEIALDSIGTNLNRNLSKLMEDNGVSLTVLHRNTGIAIPTIKRLQSDPSTNPTMTTLIPIADFFGVTINQLAGKEPILKDNFGYAENKATWLRVPLIKWEQAIQWPYLANEETVNAFVLVDIDVGINPYALTVEEDDWLNISKGSVLIIDANLKPENKDYAMVYKTGQHSPTLKQLMIDEEKIYLRSLNPYLPPSLFDETYKFLGVLIQIRKNTKV